MESYRCPPSPPPSSGGTGRWRARRLFSVGGSWSQQRTHGRSLRGLGYWPLRVLAPKSDRARSTPALGNFLHGERQAPTSVSDREQAQPSSGLLFVWRRDWMFPLSYQQGEERDGRGKVPGRDKGDLTLGQPIQNTLGTDCHALGGTRDYSTTRQFRSCPGGFTVHPLILTSSILSLFDLFNHVLKKTLIQ